MEFKHQFYSRWVLAGEHSVLRGGKALVYPLPCYAMELHYIRRKQSFQIQTDDFTHPDNIEEILKTLLSRALELLNKKTEVLSGRLFIKNSIPFCAGLGGSAALSASAAWLLNKTQFLALKDVSSFAVLLEDTFHGKSSGMDVHAVLENRPLLYQKDKPSVFLPSVDKENQPFLFLSDSKAEKSTQKALLQVEQLWKENPKEAEALDNQMAKAVECAFQAVHLKKKQKIKDRLKQSMDISESCFQKWGLIRPKLADHIRFLKASGALAAKPTGAGLGGFVVSLWDKPPPENIDLISLSLQLLR